MHNNELYIFKSSLLRCTEGVLSVLFWIFLIFGLDEGYIGVLTVICTVIHELGHYLIMSAVREPPGKIKGLADGLRIQKNALLPYRKDLLILSAGPTFNLLAAAAGAFLLLLSYEYGAAFIAVNLATACANLLPVKGHDGYGILKAALCLKYDGEISETVPRALSLLISALACLLSLYLMQKAGEGYWIFGVFYFSLLSELV